MFCPTTRGTGPFQPVVLVDGGIYVTSRVFNVETDAYSHAHAAWHKALEAFKTALNAEGYTYTTKPYNGIVDIIDTTDPTVEAIKDKLI